jgi:hypothetical protein
MDACSRGRTPSPRRLLTLCAAAVGLALAVAAPAASAADPVIMAAGDIACDGPETADGKCRQMYTSGLALQQQASPAGLAALLAIGDLQYDDGTLAEFNGWFDPSWGRLNSVLRPALGNHEYGAGSPDGYFDYFASHNVNVGTRNQGWYSYDVGSWHLIALNSSNGCSPVSCIAGSAQEGWLRDDLASTTKPCVLAYLHHPFSTLGTKGLDLWNDLATAGVDFVLAGHDHRYRKPVRRDADSPLESTIGTGGKDASGLLELTLHANGADWDFVGGSTADSGSATCRAKHAPGPPQPDPDPIKPTADFQLNADGLTVSVDDLSTGSPTSWLWSFADGSTSTDPTPQHTYAEAGTYTVTLKVTNADGSSTKSRDVTVRAKPPGQTPPPPQPPSDPVPGQQILAQTASLSPLGLRLRAPRASFRLLAQGLPLEVSGPTGRALALKITVSRSLANRAHLPRRTVATRTLGRPGVVRLRVAKLLRDALRRARGRVTITVTVRSPGLTAASRTFTVRT